jgi:hypothetical protein
MTPAMSLTVSGSVWGRTHRKRISTGPYEPGCDGNRALNHNMLTLGEGSIHQPYL